MKKLIIVLFLITFCTSVRSEEDYLKMRMDLVSSEDYNAYALQAISKSLLDEHYELANDPEKSISEINAPLKKLDDIYPLGVQVQYAVADFLDYVVSLSEDPDQVKDLAEIAKKRRKKGDAILKSILDSGDGKSREKAFQVINIVEEYAVADHFGYTIEAQDLIEHKGKSYDLITVVDKKGKKRKLWFDVSLFVNDSQKKS